MERVVIDFGLVRRAECVCGGVIIVASTAKYDRVALAVARHNATVQHRSYYAPGGAGYDPSEDSSDPPPSATRRADLTSRGAERTTRDRPLVSDPSGESSTPSPYAEPDEPAEPDPWRDAR